ncbi:MAG: ferredoxin [Pyrinomonadaceae bacterium]
MSKKKFEPTPLNVEGDFYVEKETCLTCMAPHHEAPELMGLDEVTGCYFRRQPQTPEELEHAIEAVWVSCVEALRYAGNDPEILKRLRAKGCQARIDVLSEAAGDK